MLTCSICFDTLYKPVGLQCGHVFCRDCLLQSAGVLKEGATLADLRMEPAHFHDDRIPLTNGLRRHSEGQDSAHSAEGDQEDGAVKPRLALIFWPFELYIPGPQLTASRFRPFRHHGLLCSNGARDARCRPSGCRSPSPPHR